MYGINELEKAFAKIENKAHWKNPIRAVIHEQDFAVCAAACMYYTATELTKVKYIGQGSVLVEAVGYRMGPAGP